jgi:hypothetical protein
MMKRTLTKRRLVRSILLRFALAKHLGLESSVPYLEDRQDGQEG